MQRAIITGATGVLGMAIVKELINHNIEVLVLCHEGSERNEQIPNHPLVSMKCCSLNQLEVIENDTRKRYDVFYHLAWAGTTGRKRNDMYLQNKNVQYALDAVNVAKRFGCHTFIGAGSQAEYGRSSDVLRSDTPTFPENGYGMGKLFAGLMTRELSHQNGIRHIWIRVLSIYGPYDNADSMVMYAINTLQKGEIPEFSKGEQVWDYLFSEDAAEAFRLLGENGVDGKTYVLGSGQARLLKDYIVDIKEVVSPNGEINIGKRPYSLNQPMFLCADVSEIYNDIGWKSKTKFTEGIYKILRENNLRV